MQVIRTGPDANERYHSRCRRILVGNECSIGEGEVFRFEFGAATALGVEVVVGSVD